MGVTVNLDWSVIAAAAYSVASHVPTFVQVFFWVTGAVLAILTYRRAKKSVLQPAKTEVFKLQVAKLQLLLDALNWNGSQDAWERSGLKQSFEMNVSELLQAYAKTLDLTPTPETENMWPKPASSFFREDVAGDGELVLIEPGARRYQAPQKAKLQSWADYKHIWVHMGPIMRETLEKLDSFHADPVIPTFVAEELQRLRAELLAAVQAIGPTMDKIATSIGDHYPTAEDFKEAEWGWINNQHPSEDRYGFYTGLEQLRGSIRQYLKSDQMFDL
jgi:hypothetical protein